ncbi:hypothetical protein B0T22DRAFT_104905 [Podospora appendiculata]|uniref:Uncharacterized protein n=1 Tax=Podospora appendiculata TaxID=314037 RepID=A0AAE0XM16_9PEZI|nr:hypothetical protein B0T22DRAFT_104905 [Podospora appendiculata]
MQVPSPPAIPVAIFTSLALLSVPRGLPTSWLMGSLAGCGCEFAGWKHGTATRATVPGRQISLEKRALFPGPKNLPIPSMDVVPGKLQPLPAPRPSSITHPLHLDPSRSTKQPLPWLLRSPGPWLPHTTLANTPYTAQQRHAPAEEEQNSRVT